MVMISDIEDKQNPVNVKGMISEKSNVGTITGKDGNVQKRAHAKICDCTGKIQITLWNDDATRITNGDCVELKNGYCNTVDSILNITAGYYGKIEVLNEAIVCKNTEQEKSGLTTVDKIKDDVKGISVYGTIKEKTVVATITGKNNKEQRQALCFIEDSTGKIRLTLWGDDAEKFQNDDEVYLRNAYVSNSAHGNSLTVGYFGKISFKNDQKNIRKIFDDSKIDEL